MGLYGKKLFILRIIRSIWQIEIAKVGQLYSCFHSNRRDVCTGLTARRYFVVLCFAKQIMYDLHACRQSWQSGTECIVRRCLGLQFRVGVMYRVSGSYVFNKVSVPCGRRCCRTQGWWNCAHEACEWIGLISTIICCEAYVIRPTYRRSGRRRSCRRQGWWNCISYHA